MSFFSLFDGISSEPLNINAALADVLATVSSVITVIAVYQGQKHSGDRHRPAGPDSVDTIEVEGVEVDGGETKPAQVPEQRTVDNDGAAD